MLSADTGTPTVGSRHGFSFRVLVLARGAMIVPVETR
jgi:hypothetical protein